MRSVESFPHTCSPSTSRHRVDGGPTTLPQDAAGPMVAVGMKPVGSTRQSHTRWPTPHWRGCSESNPRSLYPWIPRQPGDGGPTTLLQWPRIHGYSQARGWVRLLDGKLLLYSGFSHGHVFRVRTVWPRIHVVQYLSVLVNILSVFWRWRFWSHFLW